MDFTGNLEKNMDNEDEQFMEKINKAGHGVLERKQLPYDLVFEVLVGLPKKKLFQCKCVSKFWHSIIRHPDFVEAYRTRNSCGLVISIPEADQGGDFYSQQCFKYSAIKVQEPENFVNQLKYPWIGYQDFTQVINGLVCLTSSNILYLANIFTREILQLHANPLIFEGHKDMSFPSDNYYFGFDPVNSVYKLLNISNTFSNATADNNHYLWPHKCAILTVSSGDCSWRELANGAPKVYPEQSYLVNGVLYWSYIDKRISFRDSGAFSYTPRYALASFDLTQEKFRFIELPNNMVSFSGRPAKFRGHFSLLLREGEKLKIYMLECDDKWTMHETMLPSELRINYEKILSVGNLPTGEMLLANPRAAETFTPIYSYDPENHNFNRFVVGKVPDLRYGEEYLVSVTCMEQNIGSLDYLIRGGGSGVSKQ